MIGLLSAAFWTQAAALFAADEPAPASLTIVFDPGHGGDDRGAAGSHGSLEKDITMALARAIQSHLEQRYRIVLTRSDDQEIVLFERTAKANHYQADLLVSLHLGASFLKTTRNTNVFYYLPPQSAGPLRETDDSLREASESARPWYLVQPAHTAESRRMAELLGEALTGQAIFRKVQVSGAPLTVLQGADMPAILIEVGYLTHPATESELQDPQILEQYAAAIGQAIVNAMEKNAR